MKRLLLPVLLHYVVSLPACSKAAPVQQEQANSTLAAAQGATTDARRAGELRKQFEQIAATAKGRVGVSAVLLETGEAVSLNAREQFPMQSVYKFPIGMTALRHIDEGKLKLDGRVHVEKSDMVRRGQRSPLRDEHPEGTDITVSELLRLAVSESDGTASDVLLRLVGGAGVVDAYLKELKVEGVTVLNTEKEIGRDRETQYRNWATPDGAVALLGALQEGRGLSAASRALLLKLLTETPTGTNRLKALLPAGTIVAHKTGTAGTANGLSAATNDIGLVTLPDGRHLALAVFVSDSTADEATREGVIAKIARAAWDSWSNQNSTR